MQSLNTNDVVMLEFAEPNKVGVVSTFTCSFPTDTHRLHAGSVWKRNNKREQFSCMHCLKLGGAVRHGMMLCRDVDGLWSAFLSYLEAAPGDDEQELAALEKQLREVKQELADKRYLRGENNISAADLALVPPLTPCTIFAKHVPASKWQDYSQQASIRLPLVLPLTAWN